MFKKLKDELQRNINDSELSATDRYDLYSKLERIPRYNEVCHGNFVPSKVIISAATGEPYIIDWFHATQGNAGANARGRAVLRQWIDAPEKAGEIETEVSFT